MTVDLQGAPSGSQMASLHCPGLLTVSSHLFLDLQPCVLMLSCSPHFLCH